jgi:NitT/TauT family transport system permease protein
MRGTAPQLAVRTEPRTFGWIDAVVMAVLLGLVWSAAHFGKGMLVHFDAKTVLRLDPSPRQIPYYASRTLLRYSQFDTT